MIKVAMLAKFPDEVAPVLEDKSITRACKEVLRRVKAGEVVVICKTAKVELVKEEPLAQQG